MDRQNTLTVKKTTAATSTAPEAIPEDKDARLETMLLRYSPMVKIIVGRMRNKLPAHADIEELESVGMTGLISAIDRFDTSRGYTFETYASVRIRGAILDELRAMDMLPRSVRTKQRKLAKAVETLEQRLGRAPNDEEVREEMQLDNKAYDKLRTQTKPLQLIFLDRATTDEEYDPHEFIADESAEHGPDVVEREELYELVARKILELPPPQRKVLALYFHEGLRLAEIGEVMDLSEARVSQIRTQALAHLRKFVSRMTR